MTNKYMATERAKFRFMDLEIWQDSIDVALCALRITDDCYALRSALCAVRHAPSA